MTTSNFGKSTKGILLERCTDSKFLEEKNDFESKKENKSVKEKTNCILYIQIHNLYILKSCTKSIFKIKQSIL